MKIFTKHTLEWWEVGLVKLCLISLGILLSHYYPDQLRPYVELWWVLFALSALYFVAKFAKSGK